MRNHKLLASFLILCTVLLLSFTIRSKADFGGYSGNSDYSYSGGSSGGSYSGGGSSWGGSSYGGNSYYYGSGSGSGGDFSVMELLIWAVVIIYIFVKVSGRMQSRRHDDQNIGNGNAEDSIKGQPISGYTSLDPAFDAAALSERIGNLYVQMQNDWQKKDIEELRPYFTDAFFNQMNRGLEDLKRRKYTNYVENVTVMSADPQTYYQAGGFDHILVLVNTRIVDYTLDDTSGELVSGDRKREKFMMYEYDLQRKTGTLTKKQPELKSVVCPHCGAPLSINTTAKCPYCGSIVTVENEDWAICNIRGVAQRTV